MGRRYAQRRDLCSGTSNGLFYYCIRSNCMLLSDPVKDRLGHKMKRSKLFSNLSSLRADRCHRRKSACREGRWWPFPVRMHISLEIWHAVCTTSRQRKIYPSLLCQTSFKSHETSSFTSAFDPQCLKLTGVSLLYSFNSFQYNLCRKTSRDLKNTQENFFAKTSYLMLLFLWLLWQTA